MNIFKSFSIKATIEEIDKYIKDFEEFEPFINVSYEHYMNQIIVNYNFTLRRIKNKISWQNFIKRYLLNQKLNNYYIRKMNIIKTNKMLYYFNYWI
jgi:hypothetical protein